MKVYGIKNCDSVKKALQWLDKNGIKYEFHDYKKLGIAKEKLQEWTDNVGYEVLVNKKGTTWRKLEPAEQLGVVDEESAINLMVQKTSVIKRPIVENNDEIVVGYDEESLGALIK